MKMKRKRDAINYYYKAAELQPKNKKYQKELGLALYSNKQLSEAKKPLLAVYSDKEYDAKVTKALYEIYRKDKNKEQQKKYLKVLVKKKPGDKKYAYPLAKLEAEAKHPETVIKILEHPLLKLELSSKMSFMLLEQYMKTKQMQSATSLGIKIKQKFPNDAQNSPELAILFFKQNKKRDAKKIMDNLIPSKATPEIYYYRAQIAFEERNYNNAIKFFTKAAGHAKDVNNYLGQAYTKTKKYKQAIAAYESYYKTSKKKSLLPKLYDLYKKAKDKSGTYDILKRLVAAFPGEVKYQTALAEIYMERGEKKKAQTLFASIIKKLPNNPEANLHLGMSNAKAKSYKLASKRLQIGLKKYSKNAEAWKLLAKCYTAQNKSTLALSAYKTSFRNNSKDLDVAVAKMRLIKKLKKKSELVQAYEDVVALDSNNAEAVSALADIEYKKKNYVVAEKLYRRVVMHTKNDKKIWENYGNILLERKKTEQAKEAFEKAIKLGAKGTSIRIALARIHMQSGRVSRAEKLLKEVVFQDKTNHQAYLWLAQIALKNKQSGIAEGYLVKALRYDPGNEEYSEMLGDIYYDNDEFSKAIAKYRPVKSKLSPESHLKYAEALQKVGQNSAAFREYKALHSKKPTAKVTAKLANLYLENQEPKSAVKLIESSGFKKDPAVKFVLMKAKLEAGEFRDVQNAMNDLIKTDRTNAEFYYILGVSYLKGGDFRKAKKELDNALRYKAHYPDAIYQIGLTEMKLKDYAKAKGFFQQLKLEKKKKWKAKGHFGLAMCFIFENKWEAVEHNLEKSLEYEKSIEVMYRMTQVSLKLKKKATAKRWATKAETADSKNPFAILARVEILLSEGSKGAAMRKIKAAVAEYSQSCEVLLTFVKVNWLMGYDKQVKSNAQYVVNLCPDMEMAYFYLGMVAKRFYDKKEAKKQFGLYKKYGGNPAIIPADYR
jgi:predicted Zn-dependent protease